MKQRALPLASLRGKSPRRLPSGGRWRAVVQEVRFVPGLALGGAGQLRRALPLVLLLALLLLPCVQLRLDLFQVPPLILPLALRLALPLTLILPLVLALVAPLPLTVV